MLAAQADYVRAETLSDDLVRGPAPAGAHTGEVTEDDKNPAQKKVLMTFGVRRVDEGGA